MLRKKYYITIIFLILAGLTKEQVWVINAIFGLYLIFIAKRRLLGTFVSVFSFFIFYFLVWISIPKAHGSAHFALSYYSDYGDSPGQIIKNIIFSPIKTLQTLVSLDRLNYIKQLFLPLGYLSFFAFPFLIFAAPDLGIDLLSKNSTLHEIYYQYSATVTPFIFIAAIYGIYFLRKHIPEIPFSFYGVLLIATTLIGAYTYGPLPLAKKPQNEMFVKPLPNRQAVDNYLALLPADPKISATNNLGSHLSNRRDIYVIPSGIDRADWVLFLLRNTNDSENDAFLKIQDDPSYKLVYQNDTFYVFKRI